MGRRWWWLSFAGDDGFLGACIVEATDIVTAVMRAHALGINPGGEVQGAKIPEGAPVREEWAHRLLSKDDIREMDGGREPMRWTDEEVYR